MDLYKKTYLLFGLNHALDTGQYNVSLDEMRGAIKAGTVDDLLRKQIGKDIDVSIYRAEDWAEFHKQWQDLAAAVDAGRKFGVRRNGLCLLVAYVTESIQATGYPAEKSGKPPPTPTYH